jgi:hypothetical protein
MAISKTRPNSLFAALALTEDGSRVSPRLFRKVATGWGVPFMSLFFVRYVLNSQNTPQASLLDSEDWRHAMRLSYVSWDEARLRAARRVLLLCPGLALKSEGTIMTVSAHLKPRKSGPASDRCSSSLFF